MTHCGPILKIEKTPQSNQYDRRLQSEGTRVKTLRLNDKTKDFQASGTKAKALGD